MNVLQPKSSDRKTQAILSLVRDTDKDVGKVRAVLDGYLRNHERLRQKSIKMSLVLKSFSDGGSQEMVRMLDAFASMLSGETSLLFQPLQSDDPFSPSEREKEREKMIERIHYVSGYPLKSYPSICQKLRDEVKSRESAIDREHKKQQQLDKIMIKESNNRPKISQVQTELITATHDVSEATENLMERVRRFEDQKRLDLKTSLSELIWSEISYHARSLEILSKYHGLFGDIDFQDDRNLIDEYLKNGHAGGRDDKGGDGGGGGGHGGRGRTASTFSVPPTPKSATSMLSPVSPVSPVSPESPPSPFFRKGR
ncbi:hypothetical protein HDU67_009066 [Dinochytrium kinnereticum]|nr:hypothetical protein HDU67_009066 [Dinochytrium kinnereticum]